VHARLLTFTKADDVDALVSFLQEVALPALRSQAGFLGVSASINRVSRQALLLSLWKDEDALAASDSAMGEARDLALARSGGTVRIERFEQLSEAIAKRPPAGSSVLLSRWRADPAFADAHEAYFEGELLPRLVRLRGFYSVRVLVDRRSGRGAFGLTWENRRTMREAAAELDRSRAVAEARGIRFDDTVSLELLTFEGS
jgi:hypothetical protein